MVAGTIDVKWLPTRENLLCMVIPGPFTFDEHLAAIRHTMSLFPPDNTLVDVIGDYTSASNDESGLIQAIFDASGYISTRVGVFVAVGLPLRMREAFAIAMNLDPRIGRYVMIASTPSEAMLIIDSVRKERVVTK